MRLRRFSFFSTVADTHCLINYGTRGQYAANVAPGGRYSGGLAVYNHKLYLFGG